MRNFINKIMEKFSVDFYIFKKFSFNSSKSFRVFYGGGFQEIMVGHL